MADLRPACQANPLHARQRHGTSVSCGYCMFFAALYTSPFIGAYLLCRWAYRQGENLSIKQRRQRMTKRAENRDIAMRTSRNPEQTEQNRQSPLLKLPVELRLEIYDLVYSPSTTIIIKDASQKGHIRAVTRGRTYCPCVVSGCCSYSECVESISNTILSLSLTCRQLYAETIGHAYSKNRFHFTSYQLISTVPSIIPAKHLRSISSLSLNFYVEPLIKSLRLISRNPSVKANQPSYRFNPALVKEPNERRDDWMQLWRLLDTQLINLQHLSIKFNRMSPKGIPALEQQTCEWVLKPLLIFGQRSNGSGLKRFDVHLGFAWKDYVAEMQRRLTQQASPNTLPFAVKQSLGCKHDFY